MNPETEYINVIYFSENNVSVNSGAYPVMQITYRDTKGVEEYWTYTSMEAGNGGTININNYSGNTVTSLPLVEGDGLVMPVSLSLVHNAESRTKVSSGTKIAMGWRINYDWQITLAAPELVLNGYKYYLTDGDGTEHYFYNASSFATEWEDEDGLNYTLTEVKNGNTITGYRINDKSGGIMVFNVDGYLTAILDTNASVEQNKNRITITRESDNRIKSVTDGSGNIYFLILSMEHHTI